jgi:hypothetical protein
MAAFQAGAASSPIMGPEAEPFIVQTVQDFADRYAKAPNDMAKGALRPARGYALCGGTSPVKPAQGAVRGWVGTVERLDANNEGRGVLAVRLSPGAVVRTHSISWGDEETRTLIPIGSPLHKQALALSVGQRVRFSGMFFPSKIDCMTETSLLVSGAMTEPEFLFRFGEIQPAD